MATSRLLVGSFVGVGGVGKQALGLDGEMRRDGPFCLPLLSVLSCPRLVLCVFFIMCVLLGVGY